MESSCYRVIVALLCAHAAFAYMPRHNEPAFALDPEQRYEMQQSNFDPLEKRLADNDVALGSTADVITIGDYMTLRGLLDDVYKQPPSSSSSSAQYDFRFAQKRGGGRRPPSKRRYYRGQECISSKSDLMQLLWAIHRARSQGMNGHMVSICGQYRPVAPIKTDIRFMG